MGKQERIMKNYNRANPIFSLCGLNCGLCPMYVGRYCPGCGGGAGNQPCAIIRCSLQHGGVEYCFLCSEYPCRTCQDARQYDSFIVHRNMGTDFEKAAAIGVEAYLEQLGERMKLLQHLLAGYNDGRRKNLFCMAANLLELPVLKAVVQQLMREENPENTVKEKATAAERLLQDAAKKQGVLLKLNKRKKSKSE